MEVKNWKMPGPYPGTEKTMQYSSEIRNMVELQYEENWKLCK